MEHDPYVVSRETCGGCRYYRSRAAVKALELTCFAPTPGKQVTSNQWT